MYSTQLQEQEWPDRTTLVFSIVEGRKAACVCNLHIDENLTIEGLYTFPEYRRRGLATKILNWVMLEVGKKQVRLFVAKVNEPAIKLYKQLGFTEQPDDLEDGFMCMTKN